MSAKKEVLHVFMRDDCYEIVTESARARYALNGNATLKMGPIDNHLPDRLIFTDARTINPAANVTAESVLWGADVKWQWPKEADANWRAEIKAEFSNGEATTYQGRNVPFPHCTYLVTGVPAGKEITLTVTLHDGSGKRSKPIQLRAKSSDDAVAIVCDTFKILGGQAFINEALIGPYMLSQVGSFYSNNGEIKYCAGNDVRMRIGVNTDKAATATDKIREIVSKYLYGRASEYEDELVAELKALIEKESDHTRLATLISEQVRQRLKQETQPGGLLHKR